MERPEYEPLAEIEVDAASPSHQGFTLMGQGLDHAEYQLDLRFEMPLDQRTRTVLGEVTLDDAAELVRFPARPGLIRPDEGDRVLAAVEGPLKAKGGRRPAHPTKQRGAGAGAAAKRKAAKKKSRR